MEFLPTYTATIYCGLRKGYTKELVSIDIVRSRLSEYCSTVGFCVTMTQTEFIYKDGFELGVIVGLINYPRFPEKPEELKDRALKIASVLKEVAGQKRITVVLPDETIMLGDK